VLLTAQVAFALNKDDIVRLHEAGLDEGTIVNVIRSTTEELEMTPADVDELDAMGLPSGIIAELRLRLGITGDTGDGGTGTPSLSEELEEQRRLEEERRRLEEERLNAERDAMRDQIDREREREASIATEFQGLRRGSQAFDRGEYLTAAGVYDRFLEQVNPDPFSDEYYEAKFGLVRSLHAAGVRDAIRADALEIALMGTERRHFEDGVRILRDVVNEAGFASPRIADLSNEVVAGLSPEFQDEFNYFMGRYFFSAGELSQALNYLDAVSRDGAFASRASFLAAVVLINPEIGENIRAVQSLEQAIISADLEQRSDREVSENAYLALARIAYQVGNFGGANYYYAKIDPESQRYTTSLFESGWTYFLEGDLDRAIGTFHSLHSPYHNHRFFPDLYVLEAAAFLYSCNIDEAHSAIDAFENEIGTLRELLRTFVADAGDPTIYFRAATDPDGAQRAGEPQLPEEARRVIMGNADFHRLFRIISQLRVERDLLAAADLGQRGEDSLALVESDITNRELEAAVLVHDIVQDLLDELDDWWFKAQEVSIEIQDVEVQLLERSLAGTAAFGEGTTFVILADDWQFWPWEGEYWLDEVGNYRGNLPQRCPDDLNY